MFESNWGEQLSSVVNPIPVVLNLNTEECTAIDVSKVGDISCKQYIVHEQGDQAGMTTLQVDIPTSFMKSVTT